MTEVRSGRFSDGEARRSAGEAAEATAKLLLALALALAWAWA